MSLPYKDKGIPGYLEILCFIIWFYNAVVDGDRS
jgi:hypothetical protein